MVVATALTGRLLARWGNVGAYLLGFATFTAGSLLCAVSPAMAVLLAARGVQGLGAGLLSGLGFAVVRSALPPRFWTRGAALMSAMYGVGNFAGPAVGGLFAQVGSWRLAFAVMAVISAVCGAIVPRMLPRDDGGDRGDQGERGGGTRPPVPARSLLLVTAAAGAVSVAGVLPGTLPKVAGIAVALLLLAACAAHERRSPLRIFPRTTYRSGSSLKWVPDARAAVLRCRRRVVPAAVRPAAGRPAAARGGVPRRGHLTRLVGHPDRHLVGVGRTCGTPAAHARPGAARPRPRRPRTAAAGGRAGLAGRRLGAGAGGGGCGHRAGLPAPVGGRDVQHARSGGGTAGGGGDRHRDEPVDRLRHGGGGGSGRPGRRVDARLGAVRAVRIRVICAGGTFTARAANRTSRTETGDPVRLAQGR
ncbi:MFS transporter [Nonomuraea sp. NPDC047897]|uniref:MFS transporter n=1 Tax=Nonomuraea sp. NPDC047897 TaxID=3364346 RepID=UPI003716D118